MKTLCYCLVVGLFMTVSPSFAAAQGCGCDVAHGVACNSDPGCAVASDCGGGCAGGGCGTYKVCKLVKKEKTIKTTCYGTKCKDICVPSCGSGCVGCESARAGEASCDCCETVACCKFRYPTGEPGCAKLKNIKQLVKYEMKKQVCVWEWEIVDACCDPCGGACGSGAGCASGSGCGCAAAKPPVKSFPIARQRTTGRSRTRLVSHETEVPSRRRIKLSN